MMNRPMYKAGGKALKAVPKGKKKSLGKLPVSYTHLTLPTNREV